MRASVLAILFILVAVCLVAPNQVDRALGRSGSGTGGTSELSKLWKSVTSVLGSGEAEHRVGQGDSGGTALQQNERITTGNTGQTILTRGRDLLDMAPQTAIAITDGGIEGSTTIVKLFDGTIHVEAAKRTGGQTLSVETIYLVATVKGTVFDVTIEEGLGAAVTVTEGVVAVRATASGDAIDVTPGNTAAVLATAAGTLPIVGPTPPGGGGAAIEAARTQRANGP